MTEKTMKLHLLASNNSREIIEKIFGEEVCCLIESELSTILNEFTSEEIKDLCKAFRLNGMNTYSWVKEYLQKRGEDPSEEKVVNLYSELNLPILETHRLVQSGILTVDSKLSEVKQMTKTRKN